MSVAGFTIAKNHICVVVGLGLIGQKVADILTQSYSRLPSSNTPLRWDQSQTIITAIEYFVKAQQPQVLDIVWSAGKAGFAASDADMQAEFSVYQEVVQALNTHDIDLRFNLLSSAGGIYENSSFINHLDAISPQRPYANWKLKQESLLAELSIKSRVYRIASVYGYKQGQGRLGLINTMIKNTLNREPVKVFGNQNTLRDYIYHFDIARFVVDNLLREVFATEILASGKATSISTLINMVQRLTRQPVKTLYIDDFNNSNDIVFDRHLVPKNLRITSLEEGVLNVFAGMKSA